MPPDDRLRLHEDQVSAPVAAEHPDQDPEQSVTGEGAGALPRGARERRQLVPQQEVRGDQLGAAAELRSEQRGEERQELEHGPAMMTLNSLIRPPRLLRPDTGSAGRTCTISIRTRGGAVPPEAVREDLLAEHRALQGELEALHLQDAAGLVDAAGHERFREQARRLTERLRAIRLGTAG
jgi:hypothetical protein